MLGLISIIDIEHLRALLAKKKKFSDDPKFLARFQSSP